MVGCVSGVFAVDALVGFVLDVFVVDDSQTDLHSSFPFWVTNVSSSQLIISLQYSQVPTVVESKLQKPPVPHSAESVQLLPTFFPPKRKQNMSAM